MDKPKGQVAEIDNMHFKLLRQNVTDFMAACGKKYDARGILLLDIAPQDHAGAAPTFPLSTIQTLDIDPNSGSTYIADLCKDNSNRIPSNNFDLIVCTEVLEHTLRPFDATREIYRILKPKGLALVTTPFNFRIHGPRPDCWRFTEDGLRSLFSDFDIIKLTALEDDDRFLMPIHYSLIAQKV